MTTVVIHTQADASGYVSRWLCGARSGDVRTPAVRCSNPALAAELLALSHLVVQKSLVGNDKGTKPVAFNVSVTELPQALTDPRSQGMDVRLFSRAMRARFADAQFAVASERPVLLPGAEVSSVSSGRPIDWMLRIGDFSAVVLTEHAVRRVQERHNYANLGYAFRHIRRWAKHDLRRAELSAAVRAEKLERYGSKGTILVNDVGWHGVIVNDTLVTMFLRKP